MISATLSLTALLLLSQLAAPVEGLPAPGELLIAFQLLSHSSVHGMVTGGMFIQEVGLLQE